VSSIPPGWYQDPSGEYQYRYWDGQRWTTKTAYPKNDQPARLTEEPQPANLAQQKTRSTSASRTPGRQEARSEQAVEVSGQELTAPPVSHQRVTNAPREVKRHTRLQPELRSVEEHTQMRGAASQMLTRQQRIRGLLRGGLQDAVIINEILSPPVGLRNRREQDL